MKFTEIYYFNVMRELEKGNTVLILDKEAMCVLNAGTMRTGDLLAVLKEAEEKSKEDRYYFYTKEEREDTEI